tara:strand:+ start:896 stop:1432 length:537 start_codon:yes stop_codon:yes gene_type:complete
MNKQLILFYCINIIGGLSVLGSYAHGLISNPLTRMNLWGNVPLLIRPYYTIFMFLAAGGYFFFTSYILFYINIDTVKLFGKYGFWFINILYAGIILPSTIWIYLTFAMMNNPSPFLWLVVRLILFTVGFSSVILLSSFFMSNFEKTNWLYIASIIGLTFFCIQTMLLDAIIWPYYFPK